MAVAKGALSIMAFKKAVTWGTPVACGALDGVEFEGETLTKTVQMIEDRQIRGSAGQFASSPGNIVVAGDRTTRTRYEGEETMIAQWFGTAGVPTTVDTTARLHALRMNNSVDGIIGTLVRQVSIPEVHELTTVKVTGWTLSCRVGERATLSYRVAGHNLNINTSAGTNNNTTIATVTVPANREFLQFRQLTVRVNDNTAAALAAADAVCVDSIEISADRNHKTDDYTSCTADKISEPSPNDFSSVSVRLGFAKYVDGTGGNTVLYQKSLLKTVQKMDVFFIGDTQAGTVSEKFSWKFFFPSVQFGDGAPNVSGPGIIPYSLSGTASYVSAVPAGFPTGVLQQVALDITSQRATDPLA